MDDFRQSVEGSDWREGEKDDDLLFMIGDLIFPLFAFDLFFSGLGRFKVFTFESDSSSGGTKGRYG